MPQAQSEPFRLSPERVAEIEAEYRRDMANLFFALHDRFYCHAADDVEPEVIEALKRLHAALGTPARPYEPWRPRAV